MSDRGFSLLETLIALSLLLVALSGLAQVFATTSRATNDARRAALAAVFAAQKLEQLRGIRADLAPLSVGALRRNVDGWFDFLDDYGRSLGAGAQPPTGTIFVRRWTVESLPFDPTTTFIVRVAVIPRQWRGVATPDGGDPRLVGGAEIVTVVTRRVG
jgi:prepilin-type N-terminal cleavage/methylation domain-containing protein